MLARKYDGGCPINPTIWQSRRTYLRAFVRRRWMRSARIEFRSLRSCLRSGRHPCRSVKLRVRVSTASTASGLTDGFGDKAPGGETQPTDWPPPGRIPPGLARTGIVEVEALEYRFKKPTV
jgi:hypothetical protein